MRVSFIVEGKADKQFLTHFINHHYRIELKDEDFIVVDGNIEKIRLVMQDIKARSEAGRVNLLVFDSDDNKEATLNRIDKVKNELELDFESFLLPNNNDSGNLETLLRNSINIENRPLLKCIDGYSNCINQLDLEVLRVINDKAKMFIYVDSFIDGGISKEHQRDYSNAVLWDLDAESLAPLKKFLDKYFV